jgi:hypothetical protein
MARLAGDAVRTDLHFCHRRIRLHPAALGELRLAKLRELPHLTTARDSLLFVLQNHRIPHIRCGPCGRREVLIVTHPRSREDDACYRIRARCLTTLRRVRVRILHVILEAIIGGAAVRLTPHFDAQVVGRARLQLHKLALQDVHILVGRVILAPPNHLSGDVRERERSLHAIRRLPTPEHPPVHITRTKGGVAQEVLRCVYAHEGQQQQGGNEAVASGKESYHAGRVNPDHPAGRAGSARCRLRGVKRKPRHRVGRPCTA